jgi:hypothetical protein
MKRKPGGEKSPERVTEGLLVLTINIGDLQLLASESQQQLTSPENVAGNDSEQANRQFSGFAVLVDGHEGEREGTILQHPFFSTWSGSAGLQPQSFSEEIFKIDQESLDKLKEEGMLDYIDPISKHPDGRAYQGQWIAAMEKVEIARKGMDEFERRQPTSLMLLVQVPADSITVPVGTMAQSLAKLFFYAVIALLLAIAILWLIVNRFLRVPDQIQQSMGPRISRSDARSGSDSDATLRVE